MEIITLTHKYRDRFLLWLQKFQMTLILNHVFSRERKIENQQRACILVVRWIFLMHIHTKVHFMEDLKKIISIYMILINISA